MKSFRGVWWSILIFLTICGRLETAVAAATSLTASKSNAVEQALKAFDAGSATLDELTVAIRPEFRHELVEYYQQHSNRVTTRMLLPISRAMAMTGDTTRAADLARSYVQTYSNDWRGWRIIGGASIYAKDFSSALLAYSNALNFGDSKSFVPYSASALELNRPELVSPYVTNLLTAEKLETESRFRTDALLCLVAYAYKTQNTNVLSTSLRGLPPSEIAKRPDICQMLGTIADEWGPKKLGKTWLETRAAILAENEVWGSAIEGYSQAIKTNPDRTDAYLLRGRAYVLRCEAQRAILDLTRAIQLGTNSMDEAYFLRARSYIEERKYDKAIPDLAEAMIGTTNAQHYFYRGMCYQERGDLEKALQDLTAALAIEPDEPAFLMFRAETYRRHAELDSALKDAGRVIALEPENAEGFVVRGDVLHSQNRVREAISDWKQAVHLDSKLPEPHNSLAWVYATSADASLRDGHQAVEHGRAACELTSWRRPYFIDTLAAAYAESGKFEMAQKYEIMAMDAPGVLQDDRARWKSRLALYKSKLAYRDTGAAPDETVRPAPASKSP